MHPIPQPGGSVGAAATTRALRTLASRVLLRMLFGPSRRSYRARPTSLPPVIVQYSSAQEPAAGCWSASEPTVAVQDVVAVGRRHWEALRGSEPVWGRTGREDDPIVYSSPDNFRNDYEPSSPTLSPNHSSTLDLEPSPPSQPPPAVSPPGPRYSRPTIHSRTL